MKKAFTLIELLVVVAIMGLLGTASVGGYRQLQRGMAERGVMQNVNTFIRSAYNRAMIDRQPVEVYFWNETVREKDVDGVETLIVIGRALAVRRQGRITRVTSGPTGGKLLIDEFGDFEQYDENGHYAAAPKQDSTMRLYLMDGGNSKSYSVVKTVPRTPTGDAKGGVQEDFVTHNPIRDQDNKLMRNSSNSGGKGGNGGNSSASDDGSGSDGTIIQFGYESESDVNAQWEVGSAYGLEFQAIELPHNYIFGSSFSTSVENPVTGERKVVYGRSISGASGGRGGNSGGGESIDVYSLRPGKNGELTAQKVATADKPTASLN